MGLLFSRPPDSYSPSVTAFRTPFTDMVGPIGHHVVGPCMLPNLRWVDCLEAYGPVMGKTKCAELFQDFTECSRRFKQRSRIEDMKNERDRQWFMGLVGKGPRVDLHSKDVPHYDSFLPDFDLMDP